MKFLSLLTIIALSINMVHSFDGSTEYEHDGAVPYRQLDASTYEHDGAAPFIELDTNEHEYDGAVPRRRLTSNNYEHDGAIPYVRLASQAHYYSGTVSQLPLIVNDYEHDGAVAFSGDSTEDSETLPVDITRSDTTNARVQQDHDHSTEDRQIANTLPEIL